MTEYMTTMSISDNYKRNFYAFIWHALFLAFASTFIDVNTVLASFVLKIGGNSLHVGLLTGIYIGLPMITQLLFAGFLAGRSRKKPFLLLGIYLRVLALVGMGHILLISNSVESGRLMLMVFLWIAVFSISGAFAGISYTDLMGKIFIGSQREKLLIFKQIVSAIGMLISAIAVRHIVTAFAYPENYTIIFFTASIMLFIAAFGFLMIKEKSVDTNNIHSMIYIIRAIPDMLRSDNNLINYIVLINLTSLGITIIPFYVVFSKSIYGFTEYQIGNFLLLQFAGMIVSSIIWNWIAKYYKYKGISFGSILTGSLLPIMAIFLSRYDISVFQWIFFISGFSISAYTIALQGILLEITNNDNRAIYTGISGTLSLATAIFPLIAGALIRICGFNVIFTIISLLILPALLFLKRIKCTNQ
ncbi:MAG: MFS transporter [Desulfobacteraceae bacterium]|nr:MFS transporter [Desulfobacteraceae bacterium]